MYCSVAEGRGKGRFRVRVRIQPLSLSVYLGVVIFDLLEKDDTELG